MKPVRIKIEKTAQKRKANYRFNVHKIPRLMVPYPRLPTTEAKFYQTSVTLAPTSGGGSGGAVGFNGANQGVAIFLNNIRIGASDGQRVGKKYLIKNITYAWQIDAGTTPLTATCQWGLIRDQQTNGTFMVMGDAFDQTASGRVDALIKFDNTSKFKILARHVSHTSSATLDASEWNPTATGFNFLSFSKRKEGGLPVQCYNSDNGNVTDVQSGALYFYLFAPIINVDCYFNLHFRIKYVDV